VIQIPVNLVMAMILIPPQKPLALFLEDTYLKLLLMMCCRQQVSDQLDSQSGEGKPGKVHCFIETNEIQYS